jgi:hypothetical protein
MNSIHIYTSSYAAFVSQVRIQGSAGSSIIGGHKIVRENLAQ